MHNPASMHDRDLRSTHTDRARHLGNESGDGFGRLQVDIILSDSICASNDTKCSPFIMAASQILVESQVSNPEKRSSAARASSPDTPVQHEREPHTNIRQPESISSTSRARHALQFGQRPPASDATEFCQPIFFGSSERGATESRDDFAKSACKQHQHGTALVAGGVSSREREEEPLLQDNEDRFCMYPIRYCHCAGHAHSACVSHQPRPQLSCRS